MDDFDKSLRDLGLNWPTGADPETAYKHVIREGNLLFVSGQIPEFDGQLTHVGKVGGELDLGAGAKAAEMCALNVLHQVRQYFGGDLSKVRCVTALKVYVNAAPGFTQISDVADGASRLLKAVLGAAGEHTRTTLGVSTLYSEIPVEIDAIVSLRD